MTILLKVCLLLICGNTMSFDWKEFQEVGDNLKKTPREAYQRSAIGRYYYSCYAPVKEYFETVIRVIGSDENSHMAIIEGLRKSNEDKENDLGGALYNLRRYRNNADYHKSFKKNNVNKAQRTAKDIHKLLNELINEKKVYDFFRV